MFYTIIYQNYLFAGRKVEIWKNNLFIPKVRSRQGLKKLKRAACHFLVRFVGWRMTRCLIRLVYDEIFFKSISESIKIRDFFKIFEILLTRQYLECNILQSRNNIQLLCHRSRITNTPQKSQWFDPPSSSSKQPEFFRSSLLTVYKYTSKW